MQCSVLWHSWKWNATTSHTECTVVFPLRQAYANVPQCYVVRMLSICVCDARSQRLRKVTILVPSCLSVRTERLGSQCKDFHDIWCLRIFRKSLEKIQVSLKSDRNNRYFTWRLIHICDHVSLSSSMNEKYFRRNYRGNT